MKPTKKAEVRMRNNAQFIRQTLNTMTDNQSTEFVLNEANASTLRQLSTLSKVLTAWGFKRG